MIFGVDLLYLAATVQQNGGSLVRNADVYQLFAQNLASPSTNDMSQLICHTLYHSNAYFFNWQDFVSDVKMRNS